MGKVKRLIYILGIALVVSVPLAITPAVRAASASVYLTGNPSYVSKGSTFSVNIRENSGSSPVNVVETDISYPSDKLDLISITGASTFGFPVQSFGGGGSITIVRASFQPLSGDQFVSTLNFKAKAGGKVKLNFTGDTALISATNSANILSSSPELSLVIGKSPDISGDSVVGGNDLSILLSNYGTAATKADLDEDGQVSGLDLSILLTNYGK